MLNEMVVDRGSNSYLTNIEVYEKGRFITRVQADGVMLATPTGTGTHARAGCKHARMGRAQACTHARAGHKHARTGRVHACTHGQGASMHARAGRAQACTHGQDTCMHARTGRAQACTHGQDTARAGYKHACTGRVRETIGNQIKCIIGHKLIIIISIV